MPNMLDSSDKCVGPESLTLEYVKRMMRDDVTITIEALVAAACRTIEHAHILKDAVLTTVNSLSPSANDTAADGGPKSSVIDTAWANYRNAWVGLERVRRATTKTVVDVYTLIKEEERMADYLHTQEDDDSSCSKIARKKRGKVATAEAKPHQLPLQHERCFEIHMGHGLRRSDLSNFEAAQVRDDKPPSALDQTDMTSDQHGPLPEPETEITSQHGVPGLMQSKRRATFRGPKPPCLAENPLDAAVARERQARYAR